MVRSVVLLATAAAAGLALGAGTAEARSCHRVTAGSSVFTHVSAHNGVGCHGARHRLRRWARHGFPRHLTGWYCDTSHRRALCSYGNGHAPYFTFRRHHRARARIASRRAHGRERRAIARAIRRSPYTQGLRGKFHIRHVRVSTVGRRWGSARLQPRHRYRNRFDTATVVMHRRRQRWRLRTLGTAQLGCVIPRHAVRRDLDLGCSE